MSTISIITTYVVKGLLIPAIVAVFSVFSINTDVFKAVIHQANDHQTALTMNITDTKPAENTCKIASADEPEYWISAILNSVKTPPTTTYKQVSVLENIENSSKYWPSQVDSFIKQENSSPLTLMRIDRYYWMHYLVEMEPTVE